MTYSVSRIYDNEFIVLSDKLVVRPMQSVMCVCVFVQELLKQMTFDLDNYFNTLV